MNVLFLSEFFYPHGGGAELATYLYAKLLSGAKFNVVVVTNRFPGELDFSNKEGFIVYRLPMFKGGESVKYSVLKRFDVLFSGFMRKLMRWADVVYIPRFWFFAIPVAKAMGKPVITHLHDYIVICPLAVLYNSRADRVCEKGGFCSANCIYSYENRRRRGSVKAFGSAFLNLTAWHVLNNFMKQSNAIICVSKAQRDLIVKHAPFISEKIKVIYNPPPQSSLIPISGGDFGYFGGPSFMKGFHVLLRALRYRKHKGCKPVKVHATKFSNINAQLTRLDDLGVTAYGKLDSYEYDKIYRKIKAVIVPSIWDEPLPYVVAEAILRGRIVISSNIGGIPEMVDGCKGILLYDAGNAKKLAECIESLDSYKPESINYWGIQNRDRFLKRFNSKVSIQQFIKICENIFSKG